ncbi:DNA mismatch repair protein MutS [Nguyenibacter sp. L1]|uniref:DNA mismatch repair protein MutS n=1 Tax=Nguyenibacter sp. L1 TaxID=3049350 RepID=UPI002B467A66|nr:DNA mismatch repair protein MutS [Nguyenibacter sp. L1]WRH88347.1 DNA mismatch repair protein MutS [Nguyenibacter sp. L1]
MTLPSPDGATPAMAQWFSLKAEHPEALLFFRMGDFYELFFSDAEAAAGALDIALTARGTHGDMPIPMCGVPVGAAPSYLARLIRRGFRVAVAEQTEPPRKPGKGGPKGPLARAVVRLVTPGTLTEDELLEAGRQNLLVAVAPRAGRGAASHGWGVAWIDISTGTFETASIGGERLVDLLGRLDPAEILAAGEIELGDFASRRAPATVTPQAATARKRVAETFQAASLDAFGTFSDEEAVAAAMALDYIRRSQAGRMPRLSRPHPHEDGGILGLDPATRASLDLLRTREGGSEHTLLASVGRTVTAPGSRLLAEWIAAPLTRGAAIAARQDGWCWLVQEGGVRAALRQALRGAPDIARALGRLSLGRGLPRDAASVRDGLAIARRIARALADGRTAPPALVADAASHLGEATALEARLNQALAEDLPARLEDGGVIAPGFDGELDAERALRDDSRRIIAGLQNDYAQKFGLASLKIRHHAQLGYVIEIPAAAAGRLRERSDLILRQGTASAARFSTDELVGLDRRIAEAAERAAARERLIFAALVREILDDPGPPAIAGALARLDVLQSCADLAAGGLWCRPEVTDDDAFTLTACRHPVVEAALPRSERFTPNDCVLEPAQRVMLLTGPNMAGKSTFLRQTALAVILAQAGLPVPAKAARIGVVDRLFSRVGASDDLARGRSTFMVEMTETAAILNQAGPRSLVVVDEIGRGTATLDGLAIAWSVLEAMHSTLRCRSIFATHFHELAELAESLPRLSPHTMSVREWKGQVVFQHEVVPGSARRSWGVHVARLAGVPEPVVRRAARLLAGLEKDRAVGARPLPLFSAGEARANDVGAKEAGAKDVETTQSGPDDAGLPDAVRDMLDRMNPDELTPRTALDMVYALKKLMLEES